MAEVTSTWPLVQSLVDYQALVSSTYGFFSVQHIYLFSMIGSCDTVFARSAFARSIGLYLLYAKLQMTSPCSDMQICITKFINQIYLLYVPDAQGNLSCYLPSV